ncbi:hypothetical protein M9H77_08823 [Catharanthus roseus]|uniref:Uncharacterized protein n=1 Tax=Catharanthus roseus TaxID=4058 RepID=A0ACC0BYU3_CATRO|nr:hypothetical protein M9H77_08823 [Catharanthus roseus]
MPRGGVATARHPELFSPTSSIRALFIRLAAEFLFIIYRLAAGFIWFIVSRCFSKTKTQAWFESKRYEVSVSWREFLCLCVTQFCNQNQT